MEDYIMIHITFCYETDLDLTYMKNEITKCFEQRGVCVSACCCHNAAELLKRSSSQLPDILFYDLNGEQGLMRKAAIAVKKKQQNMVSVVLPRRTLLLLWKIFCLSRSLQCQTKAASSSGHMLPLPMKRQ